MLLPHIGELPALTSGARNSSVRCCASATLVRLGAHPRQQARGAVLALIPVVHAHEQLIGLMDGEHRAITDELQLPVGHHGGDLDDRIGVGLQTRHLQIDPDQMVTARHGAWVVIACNDRATGNPSVADDRSPAA